MKKKVIAKSFKTKSGLFDDDYTLYDNGEILHEYDKNAYPGGYNLSEMLSIEQVGDNVKQRLLESSSEENKKIVKEILGY